MACRTSSAHSKSGKLADLVVFKPALFGVKPELVLKGGFIAWANMGDPECVDPHAAADVLSSAVRCRRPRDQLHQLTFVSQASLRQWSAEGPGTSPPARSREELPKDRQE